MQARIVRQADRDRWTFTALGEVGINEVTHGAQVRGVLAERGIDGLGESVCTMGVEDLQEPAGEDP